MTLKVILSALFLSFLAWGQTAPQPTFEFPPQAPPVQTAPPVPAPPIAGVTPTVTLPSNWVGAFTAYNTGASPKMSGGFSEASLISSGAQLYSFSTWDVAPVKISGSWQFQSTPRTGLAMVLKIYGPVYIIGFGNMGVGTAGSNVSFATSGGGVVVVKLGKSSWTLFGGYHVLNTGAQGGTRVIPEFGFGRIF